MSNEIQNTQPTGLAAYLAARGLTTTPGKGPPTGTVILIDGSGSMLAYHDGRQAWKTAVAAVSDIWKAGMIAYAFGDDVWGPFTTPTAIERPCGSTNMTDALVRARQHAPHTIIIISDGEPDNEDSALKAAKATGATISCVYIGKEDSDGAKFMAKLTQANKGKTIATPQLANLSRSISGLLPP